MSTQTRAILFYEACLKIWGKSVEGWMSYDLTNKQTDRQTNRDYYFIYRWLCWLDKSSDNTAGQQHKHVHNSDSKHCSFLLKKICWTNLTISYMWIPGSVRTQYSS